MASSPLVRRRPKAMAGLGSLARHVLLRYRWRAALDRLGLDGSSARLVDVADRTDGRAITLTVESRTRQAAELLSDRGAEALSWALGHRVVPLGSDPYRPTFHMLLVETALSNPAETGHLIRPKPATQSG